MNHLNNKLNKSCPYLLVFLLIATISSGIELNGKSQSPFTIIRDKLLDTDLLSDLSNFFDLWNALTDDPICAGFSDCTRTISSDGGDLLYGGNFSDLGEKNGSPSEIFSDSGDFEPGGASDGDLLGSDDSMYESLEIVQYFSYSRHGASTESKFLYPKEYEPYHILQDFTNLELLTALGKAQCWALGRHLYLFYTEFVEDSISKDSYLFNLIELAKNKLCARFFWFGLNNFVPFIGDFKDKIVGQAINRKGNCHQCTVESHFPYEKSQEFSDISINTNYPKANTKMHRSIFLDLDDSCVNKRMFLNLEVDNLPKRDVQILERISPGFRGDWDSYNAILYISKHIYHNLPMEYGLEELSRVTINRSLKIKDGMTENYLFSYLSVHKSHWVIPALFARQILKDLRANLVSQENALNIYIVHNNNLTNLLIFLLGARSKLRYYISWFGSTAAILVWQDKDTGQKYVQLKLNEEILQIRNCEKLCQYEKFLDILDESIELGGDLREFCSGKDLEEGSE